jgi:hypothetical protein
MCVPDGALLRGEAVLRVKAIIHVRENAVKPFTSELVEKGIVTDT